MRNTATSKQSNVDYRLVAIAVVSFALIILGITWVSIKKSRSDSYNLLVQQGTAFTNALADGAGGAIAAESYYDRFTTRHYSDLVSVITAAYHKDIKPAILGDLVDRYDLLAVYIYGYDSSYQIGCSSEGALPKSSRIVDSCVYELISEEDNEFSTFLGKDNLTGDDIQLYCEKVYSPPSVVVLKINAYLYNQALRETGIGYIAQRMSQSEGIEYIFYQTSEGIVFASRETGQLLSIESDPFLSKALSGDTICTRITEFQNKSVLELARPFSTKQYRHGLFRVGVSLEGYYRVARSYDFLMIILSGTLFILMSVAFLYLGSRKKRQYLSREYSRVKSITDRVFDQMKVGIAVIGEDNIVMFANPAFLNLFSIHDTEGKLINDISPDIAGMMIDAYHDKREFTNEKEITVTIQNRQLSILVACSTVTYDDQSGMAVIFVVYDITEIKKYEREASRRERLSEMGNLAAGVAHEIRNPLNTISIAAQRLATEFTPSENPEEYQEFTKKIHGETRRLNEIITRFLALARENKTTRNAVNLNEVLNDFITLVSSESKQLHIDISVSILSNTTVIAKSDEIQQILHNLYNNSKEAFKGKPGRISIVVEHQSNHEVIKFSDNGPGIPQNLRSQVFAPFFTTKDSGTGLGLPTVHKIVTEIGGEITIEDHPEGGTTFKIVLPNK